MKAQATLEALIAMAAAIAVLSVFASISVKQFTSSQEFMKQLKAESAAEKCAEAINAMSANSGAVLNEWNENCSGKNSAKVYWSNEEREASSRTLAIIRSVQKENEQVVRVENETHYR